MIEKVNDINDVIIFIKTYFPNYLFQNDPYEKLFCYKKNNKIIGFVSYSIIYERAELNYIVTDKNFRRRGIAQKLLDFTVKDLKKNRVESFSLEVDIDNKEALDFYLKNGFMIKAIRNNYYKNKDAYLMVMDVI